jgi:ABC-type nitrate/sulfonate/bicarbonate transport system permease component
VRWPPRKLLRNFGPPLFLLILLDGMAAGFKLWFSHPILVLGVNLVVFLYLADAGAGWIPARRRPAYERALSVSFPLLLLLAWELLVRAGILNPRWFPPPTKILAALWDLTVSYDPYNKTSLLGRPWLIPQEYRARGWAGVTGLFSESHVLATLVRVFAGFLLGSLPGIVVGVVMGISRTVRVMLDATLSAVYVLPKIAIFPIMMLIFADPFGEGPKIAVVAISAFFLVTINTMAGVAGIERVYFEAGRNYGANRWQMFRHVIIPGALPVIAAGLRLALGTALIVIVAIEFVRARKGVGFLTLYYWEILVTEKMYAGLLVIMLLGVGLTYGLQWLERRIMPWKEEERSLPPPG